MRIEVDRLTKSSVYGFLDDRMNRQVLSELLEDSRRSVREIARKLKVAPGTVMSRVRQMESTGIIEKYTAKISHTTLGLGITAIIKLSVSTGTVISTDKSLLNRAGVQAVYRVTGDCDVMVVAKFMNTDSLNKFTDWLIARPGILNTCTHIVLNTGKEDYNSI